MVMRPRRTKFNLRFRLTSAMIMLVGFLLIAEGVSRPLVSWAPEWRAGDNAGVLMVGHPTRLWGFGPGIRSNGPGVSATISLRGLREPEPELPRPAGRSRVLVLGDSTFFGHGVEDDETLGRQLEAQLKAGGLDVDSANGAISGYSTEQTLLLLEEDGWALDPTLLIIGNLWSDNNSDGFRDMDLLRTVQLNAENPLAASAFFQLMVQAVDRWGGGDGAQVVTWPTDGTYPDKGVRRVPLNRYAQNLDTMVQLARSRKVGVLFLAPCNQGILAGHYTAGAAWDPYFATMAAVAAHHTVPIVWAKDALKTDRPVDELFVDVLHPSAEGMGLLAAAVAERLLAEGWPGNPLISATEKPFPFESVVDTATNFVFVSDASSPQSWLFPGRMPSGHGQGAGSPGEDQPWILTGRVLGTDAVEVVVKDGDTVLATRSLPDGGWFEVPLSPKYKQVQVDAVGATGEDHELVSFDIPAVTLELK